MEQVYSISDGAYEYYTSAEVYKELPSLFDAMNMFYLVSFYVMKPSLQSHPRNLKPPAVSDVKFVLEKFR